MAWKWMSWQRFTFVKEKALAEMEQRWERRESHAGTGPGGAESGSWGWLAQAAAGRGRVAGIDSECSSEVG